MKKSILAVIVLVLTIALAANAMAASLSLPSVVLAGQDVYLPKGSLDCDDNTNYCVINLTKPDSTTIFGWFETESAQGDPDNADQHITFTDVGTYTVSIYQCSAPDPTGPCPLSPSDTQLVEVLAAGGSLPGTLSIIHYGPTASWTLAQDTLRVFGNAPSGAAYAEIKVRKLDMSVYQDSGMLPVGDSYGYYDGTYEDFFGGVSSWDPEIYEVVVFFYDNTSTLLQGRALGTMFVDPAIAGLQEQLDTLETRLDGLNESLQQQIDDLRDELNASLGDINVDIEGLQAQIDALAAQIAEMNHGTINLYHDMSSGNELRVWGEAPEGALTAKVRACTLDVDPTTCRTDNAYVVATATVTTGGDNENWYNAWIDISSWDAVKYNIYVTFEDGSGWMNGYNVGQLFDDLFLLDLEAQVVVLQNDVENLTAAVDANTGNITALWNDSTQQWDAIHDLQIENWWQWHVIHMLRMENHAQWHAIHLLQWSDFWQWHEIHELDERVDALEEMLNRMNHGTINLFHQYNEEENRLRVWGEAPEGAVKAVICVKDLDSTVGGPGTFGDCLYLYEATVESPYENENWYDHWFDISEWDPIKYNVLVYFFAAGDDYMSGYNVGQLFDDLYILWIEGRVDDIETDLYGYLDGIAFDYATNVCWDYGGLPPESCTIEQFCELSAEHVGITSFLVGMPVDYLDDFTAVLGLDDLAEVTYLWDACKQVQIWELQATVYGDEPEGLRNAARLKFCDWREEIGETGGFYLDACTGPIPQRKASWNERLDELGLDDRLNRLSIQFYSDSIDQWENIDQLWDEVWALWGEVFDLWDAIEAISHGTINLFHEYEKGEYNRLRVWGEAPAGAATAIIRACPIDVSFNECRFNDAYTVATDDVEQLAQNELTYFTVVDVSEWETAKYNIFVLFEDDEESIMRGYSVSALFDDLLLIWLEESAYGFDFKDTQYFEVWNQQDSFVRKISWAFTPQWSGPYSFEIVNPSSTNGQDIGRQFADGECFWLNRQQHYTFANRNVVFPAEEGSYRVKLVAHPCYDEGTENDVTSNRFRLIVDDIAKPWPEYEVTAVAVDPDSENLAEGVYWTNEPIVDIEGLLGSGVDWMNDQQCTLWNERSGDEEEWQLYERWQIREALFEQEEIPPEYCEGDVDLSEIEATRLQQGSAPEYDLQLCAHPIAGQIDCDDLTYGLDTQAPVISNLNPGEETAVSGVYIFGADVTDDGVVREVEFYLRPKEGPGLSDPNATACYLGTATEPTEGDTYEIEYDTNVEEGCTPDGYYDFIVVATDYADNTATEEIDPIVDNTPPVVESVGVSGFVGSGFTVTSEITDNLAGVASAYAELIPYECEDAEPTETVCTNTTLYNESSEENETVEECIEVPLPFCEATRDCEERNYEVEVDTEIIELSLTSGDALSGTWTGSSDENDTFQEGVHYEVRVHAWDAAGNENEASNAEETMDELYTRLGYTVTLTVPTEADQNALFPVSGSVYDSEGSPVDSGDVLLSPWSSAEPLLLGGYAASKSLGTIGVNTITATFTPDAACEESFGASATIAINAVVSGGGGGGGGGSFGGDETGTGCLTGYSWDGEQCVKNPEPPKETSSSSTTTPTNSGSEGTESEQQEQPSPEEQPPVEPVQDDLVTGAVTGGGIGTWGWLAIVLGLLVVLFGLYYWLKK